ncbi:MAG: hypothetical protein IBJ11_11180 [Phycisphaerales bacterium]|nr:hypothetical protein [Phycisphaerales bacterium]
MARSAILLGLVASAGIGGASHAAIVNITGGVPLSTVVGNQFIVEDKLFTISNYSSGTGVDPTTITISPVNGGLSAIGFRMTGNFSDSPLTPSSYQFQLNYTVEILNQSQWANFFIVGSALAFNAMSSGAGSFATISETVVDPSNAQLIGNMNVTVAPGPPPTSKLSDSLTFSPRKKLFLTKDVQFFASPPSGQAFATQIDQTFSQVPAPGAVGLVAAAGLLGTRRRQRA